MVCGRDAGAAPQDHWPDINLPLYSPSLRERLVSRIPGIGAGGPFPTVAKELLDTAAAGLGWMQLAGVEQVAA